jgi:hypothetical protein
MPKRIIMSLMLLNTIFLPQNFGATPFSYVASRTWKKVELKHFSFYIPPRMKLSQSKGIDSAVWRYTGNNLKLTIDLGLYSGKPSVYEEEIGYREEIIKINGKIAIMCFFQLREPVESGYPYVAAVYFEDIDSKDYKLSFFASCASPIEQETARKIFSSIVFKEFS